MRKSLFIVVFFTMVGGCAENSGKDTSTTPATNLTDTAVNYPFTAIYSASFEMGDKENARIVLNTWKAWQDNQLEDSKSAYADSVLIQFEDGTTLRGNPDQLVQAAKKARSNFSEVKDTLIAVLPVRSKDKKEEWVLLYGVEYTIDKKGKADTTQFHQVWRIRNHKAEYMARYKAIHR